MYIEAMAGDIEKRRFPRVSVNFVTVEVYSDEGAPRDPELSFVVNVSEGGMMFRSERDYEKNQRILVTFALPDIDGNEAVIRTDAMVIHAQKLETSQFFGVQFRGIGLAERQLLRRYVNERLEEEKTRRPTS